MPRFILSILAIILFAACAPLPTGRADAAVTVQATNPKEKKYYDA